jgi:hypothetical protein
VLTAVSRVAMPSECATRLGWMVVPGWLSLCLVEVDLLMRRWARQVPGLILLSAE